MCRQVLVGSSSGNKGKLFSKALIHLTEHRVEEGHDDELVYIECPLDAIYDDENDAHKILDQHCDNPDFGLIIITDIDLKCIYELKWLLRKIDKEKVFVISTVQNLEQSPILKSIEINKPKIVSDENVDEDDYSLVSLILARPASKILKEIKGIKKISDKQLVKSEITEDKTMDSVGGRPATDNKPTISVGNIDINNSEVTLVLGSENTVTQNKKINKKLILKLIKEFQNEMPSVLQPDEVDEAQNCLNEIEIELKKPDPNTNIIVKSLNMLKKFKGAIEFVKVVAEACNVVKELVS